MEDFSSFLSLVDFTKSSLWYSAFVILIAPTIWNILARTEYYTHWITKLTGSPYRGCYCLALYIFLFSLYRDKVVTTALLEQPQWNILGNQLFTLIAVALFVSGSVFVLSSMWALGITGTYLGDYFGILMDDRVTSFPFNILDNPMYDGSTLCFLGSAIWHQSPAGLLLTIEIFIVYRIALLFEEPFTAYIYGQRDKLRKQNESNKQKKK